MSQIAQAAGLVRKRLYKAFAPGAKPRFEAVLKVIKALGLKLTAEPATEHTA